MFKVNNKDNQNDAWSCSGCFYCWLWTYFIPCSSVSIINFVQVNSGWDIFSNLKISLVYHIFFKLFCWKDWDCIRQKLSFKDVLQISQENTCVGLSFFNFALALFYKVWLQACIFIKKRIQNRCFSAKLAKFLRKRFLQKLSRGCFTFVGLGERVRQK